MGSSFFQKSVDPVGSSLGGNSTLGRSYSNDPVNNFLFGTKQQSIPATAGPWAGTAPSLSSAAGGYGVTPGGSPQLSGGAGNNAQLNATFGAGKW